MSQSRITFLPYHRTIEVSEGDSLIRTALQAGVHINASCGGEGVCAKCRVQVEEGEIGEGLSERLSPEDIEAGYRLACQAGLLEMQRSGCRSNRPWIVQSSISR